ncbi:MAG: S1 RNA-binding domain-containing protein [Planctomycetota bacterium]
MNTEENPVDPNTTQDHQPSPVAETTPDQPTPDQPTPDQPTPESEVTPEASTVIAQPVVESTATVSDDQASPAETPAEVPTEAPDAEPVSSSETATEPKPRIAIGSQRDAADKSSNRPAAVQAAMANPIDLSPEDPEPEIDLPDIISDAGLSSDVEAEIEAALGSISMDDVVSKVESTEDVIEPGTKRKGQVARIHGDNVFVKLDGLAEGVAALHQFKEPPAEGAEVELIVRGLNREDGLYEMAVPGAAIGATGWDELNEGDVVEAKVTATNTGGLEATVASIKGFIPASQIDRFRVNDLNAFLGQKLTCVVVESNPDKRRLVLSRRAILDRENEEKRKKLLEELEAGQIREGTVTKLMDFGAFVDLGGAEGLIHISKLSWSRVKHPSDVVQVGEQVKVKVESVDHESNRIGLSHRDTLEHPWENVNNDFEVNQVVKGTVTRIADFGAFVKVAHGVEGLVHISELSHKRVVKVSNVVSEGQELDVKILSIDTNAQKISLSHKATLAAPLKKESSKPEEPETPARDLAVPERKKPLKGGTDRQSGGESIGLKW